MKGKKIPFHSTWWLYEIIGKRDLYHSQSMIYWLKGDGARCFSSKIPCPCLDAPNFGKFESLWISLDAGILGSRKQETSFRNRIQSTSGGHVRIRCGFISRLGHGHHHDAHRNGPEFSSWQFGDLYLPGGPDPIRGWIVCVFSIFNNLLRFDDPVQYKRTNVGTAIWTFRPHRNFHLLLDIVRGRHFVSLVLFFGWACMHVR